MDEAKSLSKNAIGRGMLLLSGGNIRETKSET